MVIDMDYRIYRFDFKTGVHLGKRSPDEAEYTIGADTFFSAMCQEWIKQGKEQMEAFLQSVLEGRLLFSDAFPYINNTCYIPKPMLKIDAEQGSGDSVLKKAYKNLSYLPMEALDDYLQGKLDVKRELNLFREGLGHKTIKTGMPVRGNDSMLPYRVGIYAFKPGSGLYMIAGYEWEEDRIQLEKCLNSLAFSGIGGKRSAGLGRFSVKPEQLPEHFLRKLEKQDGSVHMSLSVGLPREEEMEQALSGSNYLLVKRSGFVASTDYADRQMRRRDLYVMKAGACFRRRFEGDVYDVGGGGSHPVYRYAKPLFMEVIA